MVPTQPRVGGLPICQFCSLTLWWQDHSVSHPLSNPREKRQLFRLASSSISALSFFSLVQVTCLSFKQSLQPKGWGGQDWRGGLGSVPPVPQGLRMRQGCLPTIQQDGCWEGRTTNVHYESLCLKSPEIRSGRPEAGTAGLKRKWITNGLVTHWWRWDGLSCSHVSVAGN